MPRRTLETAELVGVHEIADLCEVSPRAVCNWQRRDLGFPEPVRKLASGPVFYWPDVEAWLIKTGRFAA